MMEFPETVDGAYAFSSPSAENTNFILSQNSTIIADRGEFRDVTFDRTVPMQVRPTLLVVRTKKRVQTFAHIHCEEGMCNRYYLLFAVYYFHDCGPWMQVAASREIMRQLIFNDNAMAFNVAYQDSRPLGIPLLP